MADFTGPDNGLPMIGSVVARFNKDLGADPALTLTGKGAGTFNGSDLVNAMGRGVRVTTTLSGVTGTISVVVNIQIKDQASGAYTTVLSSAALIANGSNVLLVHPNIAASANAIAQNAMSEIFRVQLVSGAGSTPNFNSVVGVCLLA